MLGVGVTECGGVAVGVGVPVGVAITVAVGVGVGDAFGSARIARECVEPAARLPAVPTVPFTAPGGCASPWALLPQQTVAPLSARMAQL